MTTHNVRVKLVHPDATLPRKMSDASAGYDLYAAGCCQSATLGQIGTRENCRYGEPALSSLTVRL